MSIAYRFKKTQLLTDPSIEDYENVIAKVKWQIILTDGTSESITAGETDLDTSNLTNFIPAGEVSDSVLVEWVINAHGGQAFIDHLIEIHAPFIEKKTAESKLVEYYTDPEVKTFPY